MHRFAAGAVCRHRALSEYFGQEYEGPGGSVPGCGACDVCLGDLQTVPDSTVIAQKILSCVARCGQGFGAAHIADVLRGSETERVIGRRHHLLTTFGLMRGVSKALVLGYVNQLVDQGLLARSGGEYPVLVLTEAGVEVMRGRREAMLLEPKRELAAAGRVRGERRGEERPLTPEEAALFDALRGLRMRVAQERNLPPYVVFTDATLRDMARARPVAERAMAGIRGVGERKLADLGPRFAGFIAEYCAAHGLEGAKEARPGRLARSEPAEPSESRKAFFELYRGGMPVDEAAQRVGRARSTALQALVEFIEREPPETVRAWVDDQTYAMVAQTATKLNAERIKPIFEHLGGSVSYEQIRIVMAHLRAAR
jgi:ATP-dependent DNA helicase RecQ